MPTIKERRAAIYAEFRQFRRDNPDTEPEPFLSDTFIPTLQQIENDCQAETGHINPGTITREEGSKYYICDDCRKLIELGYE